tara:strand:- start:598 stop:744 length:147 start_codon:yes stop_codon:yes gene_type:complete
MIKSIPSSFIIVSVFMALIVGGDIITFIAVFSILWNITVYFLNTYRSS